MRADIERAMPDRAVALAREYPPGLPCRLPTDRGATQHMRILTTATCLLLLGTAIGCARNGGSVALDSDRPEGQLRRSATIWGRTSSWHATTWIWTSSGSRSRTHSPSATTDLL